MFKNKIEGIRSEKGFTMIELIIVIAIMGILSAILVPSFTEMTRKSRLRSDISTIQQVDAQIQLYMAEKNGKFPDSDAGGGVIPTTGTLSGEAVTALVDGGYIKDTDTVSKLKKAIKLQSGNTVEVEYNDEKEHLVLNVGSTEKIFKTAKTLGDSDKLWTTVAITNP